MTATAPTLAPTAIPTVLVDDEDKLDSAGAVDVEADVGNIPVDE
jgi:hypothetical protein